MTQPIRQAIHMVSRARSVVVLSGAGMSAESGVPTFRDAQTGLWQRFSPEQLATEHAFRRDAALVWTWYIWRWHLVQAVEPHAGHRAVGAWQQQLATNSGSLFIATQNVDDLHERGGANGVRHLHGSLHTFRCIDCHHPADFDPWSIPMDPSQDFNRDTLLEPVACEHCVTGILRPDVVWFGETLPQHDFEETIQQLQRADLIVVVGTSGLVQPAASLPNIGRAAGAAIIEINPVVTDLSNTADVYIASTAAVAIPALLNDLF